METQMTGNDLFELLEKFLKIFTLASASYPKTSFTKSINFSDEGMPASDGCCRCCCSFMITFGLTALFMWLSLRTSKPTCSVEKLYVAALNTTGNQSNRTIYLDLKLANVMNDKGVHYANITLSFYFNSSLPIANYTVPGFYQGHKKTTHRRHLVPAPALALDAVSNGSAVSFRVSLATRVKFKIIFWYTKRHRFEVAGDVQVNATGNMVSKKNVKLKSGAPELLRHWLTLGPLLLITFFIILFL